jgi:Tol biopolymer transport system component
MMVMRSGRYNFKLMLILLVVVGSFYGVREFSYWRYIKQQESQPVARVGGKIIFNNSGRDKIFSCYLLENGKMRGIGAGRNVFVDSNAVVGLGFNNFYITNLNNKLIKEINLPKGANPFEFDISPDGKWIVFSSTMGKENYTHNLYLIDSDGKNLTQVTSFGKNSEGAGDPKFSHDGEDIAFIAPKEKNKVYIRALYICKEDGSQLKELSSDKIEDAQAPSWSPDKKEIAFSALDKIEGDGVYSNIHIINLKENKIRALTSFNGKNFGHAWHPCWSPDGKQICFSLETRGNHNGMELFAINIDGTNLIRLTPAKHINRYPGWVSDLYPDWRR